MKKINSSTFIILSLVLTVFFSPNLSAQKSSDMPYHQIPDTPADYNMENVVARMIDGLGYRFHWATESLSLTDYAYRPEGENTRSILETQDHIRGLAEHILNVISSKPNIRPYDKGSYTPYAMRQMILKTLEQASNYLKSGEVSLEELNVTFKRGEQESSFPFWNFLNGPLTDAIYHTGQIVSYRRSAGNPQDPAVNVFSGKNREAKK